MLTNIKFPSNSPLNDVDTDPYVLLGILMVASWLIIYFIWWLNSEKGNWFQKIFISLITFLGACSLYYYVAIPHLVVDEISKYKKIENTTPSKPVKMAQVSKDRLTFELVDSETLIYQNRKISIKEFKDIIEANPQKKIHLIAPPNIPYNVIEKIGNIAKNRNIIYSSKN